VTITTTCRSAGSHFFWIERADGQRDQLARCSREFSWPSPPFLTATDGASTARSRAARTGSKIRRPNAQIAFSDPDALAPTCTRYAYSERPARTTCHNQLGALAPASCPSYVLR